ncbi:PREDICTED: transmembrane protein 138, partial [Lepidothrix coronata]|uniref:Transmembrane protein 138 n=1 Tax=Lepidothrix coronata TaxID=321398 RepID=A0A6J0J675_9PASS
FGKGTLPNCSRGYSQLSITLRIFGKGAPQTAPGVIPGFPSLQNLRWRDSSRFIWTEGLQTLFVFQRLAAVLYCYFYKRTAVHLGDPLFYQDSLWLRQEFAHFRG